MEDAKPSLHRLLKSAKMRLVMSGEQCTLQRDTRAFGTAMGKVRMTRLETGHWPGRKGTRTILGCRSQKRIKVLVFVKRSDQINVLIPVFSLREKHSRHTGCIEEGFRVDGLFCHCIGVCL